MGVGSGGGGRGRRRGGRSAPMADINVTPLVDVMLVLLIIFMVTAPLLVAGVPINLPDSRARPLDETEQEPVLISIDASGQLFVDADEVTAAQLPARLAAIAATQGDDPRTIMLRADRGIDYGRVMRVMGELNAAGLNRISMVTTGSDGSR